MAGWGTLAAAPVALGVGEAAGAAIQPVLEPLRQEAWAKRTPNLLELGILARLVAQGLIDRDTLVDDPAGGISDVHRLGFTAHRFDAVVQLELAGPDVAELLELWRRGLLGPPDSDTAHKLVDHGLAKAQIEPQYWGAIKELFSARVAPPTIALAVQRGILENVQNPNGSDRLLTVTPDVSAASINSPGQVPLDVLAEARSWGWDFDRLAVDARIAGLPPAPGELMQLLNRKHINSADFLLGIAEGDTRNEWAKVLENLRFRVLSGVEAAELHVRGWIDQQTMYDLGELDGWTNERMDYLYDLRGRPLSLHQAFIGERRGGVYDGPTDLIPPWALDELHQSNIRPPWFNLAWAQRHSLPSAFVIRALLTDGAWTRDRGYTRLLESGWKEEDAADVADHYSAKAGGSTDPHVAKAQTQLWGTIHTSYKNGEIDEAQTRAALPSAGVSAGAIDGVIAAWDVEKALPRKTLTAAQVKKAYGEAAVNEATGAAWTQDEAVAALMALGYTAENALSYLNI